MTEMKPTEDNDRKPLLTLRLYKRHILAIIIFIVAGMFLYSIYFKFFMVLPQTAINVMPELPTSTVGQRLLVLAPHCDDEILGAGGFIHRSIQNGSVVKVVVVTDCNKRKIGNVRKNETKAGLMVEGLSSQNIEFLDLPEGESRPGGAIEFQIAENLKKELDSFKPTIVVLPSISDTHRDHKATGIAGEQAMSGKTDITALYYLIHYNFLRFPSPPGLHPEDYLLPPARLINLKDRWYKFSLTQEEVDLKEEAIGKYKSQLSLKNPILVRVLWDFARQNELFMIKAK